MIAYCRHRRKDFLTTILYERAFPELFKNFFEAIKETRCTCFIIFLASTGMILEALYDVGIRSGSFISVDITTVSALLTGINEPYYSKRKELLTGVLGLVYKEYSGSLGEQIEK